MYYNVSDLGYVRRSGAEGSCEGPCVRRYHSAVVYGGDMFVFGGYVDINGSSNELWKYHIGKEKVVLLELLICCRIVSCVQSVTCE